LSAIPYGMAGVAAGAPAAGSAEVKYPWR